MREREKFNMKRGSPVWGKREKQRDREIERERKIEGGRDDGERLKYRDVTTQSICQT